MPEASYFNSVPHYRQYGKIDEEGGESWVQFYRNNVRFDISVSRPDVAGTRFGQKWTELNRERRVQETPRREINNSWNLLSDFMISQCLDLIEELGPSSDDDRLTLRNLLHTPCYKLKIVADEQARDAKGEVIEGPTVAGAGMMSPLPAAEVGLVTNGLVQYRSDDLYIQYEESMWGFSPNIVRTADGTTFTFVAVDVYVRSGHGGTEPVITNDSIDRIRMYSTIQMQCEEQSMEFPKGIPRMVGYVTDVTDPLEVVKPDMNRKQLLGSLPEPSLEPETLIAGVLLDCAGHDSMSDRVRQAATDSAVLKSILADKESWKSQMVDIVKDLHARGMACGKFSETWYSINQHTVQVDPEQNVWLRPFIHGWAPALAVTGSKLAVSSEADFEEAKGWDMEAVERIFEEYLPEELTKIGTAADDSLEQAL